MQPSKLNSFVSKHDKPHPSRCSSIFCLLMLHYADLPLPATYHLSSPIPRDRIPVSDQVDDRSLK